MEPTKEQRIAQLRLLMQSITSSGNVAQNMVDDGDYDGISGYLDDIERDMEKARQLIETIAVHQ